MFDVGETLVDETAAWTDWAEWLGVPTLTLFAALGALIEQGRHHREVIPLLRPDLELATELDRRRAAGRRVGVHAEDLYPDAVPTLRALRKAGYRIGIAANQPRETEAVMSALGVPLDLVGSSESWGVEKPDPRFFERIASELELPPAAIAYLGDRIDNDVRPSAAAGMRAIFIRRGPWALIQAGRDPVHEATATMDRLDELLPILTAP